MFAALADENKEILSRINTFFAMGPAVNDSMKERNPYLSIL